MSQRGCAPGFLAFCAQALLTGTLWGAGLEELDRSFDRPPDDARIMMRWWWFGPAVTRPQLAREMQLMKDGGIGGFEVQPVYPLALDDPAAGIKNLEFLSPEFLANTSNARQQSSSQVLFFTQRTLPPRPTGPPGATAVPPPLDLSRDWSVSFGRERAPVKMETLGSWTEDDATRHFSGVATYEKTVRLHEAMLAAGLRLELNFGTVKRTAAPATGRMQALVEVPVREAAVVYVNGRRAGSLWCPPYRLDVTGLLESGENPIKVDVANLALNAMAGRLLPDYTALRARYGDRFQPQEMNLVQPITAGVLGPIQLVATVQP